MKIDASRKLILTTLLIAFFTLLSSLLVNLLTNDNKFKAFTDKYLGTTELVAGVIILAAVLLVFTYFQLRYAKQSERTTEKEDSAKDGETDVERFYDSLEKRYRNRYESKLDGRFEITLEVSENWDGDRAKKFKGEYEGKGRIGEAFEYIRSAFEKQRRLLIVGNPGVGKTVLLLKLALELLEKADIEKKEAFPVIFNLASWSYRYKRFDDWLISVLNSGEGLSKDFAAKLLREERIVFLLDGLDELARNEDKEIAAKIRSECLQSLNDYLDRGKQAVICCRVIEFELMRMLTEKDAPVSAKVEINDLSPDDVLNSLRKARTHKNDAIAAANLLDILNKDKNIELPGVLSTPFYFTTALEVFDKQIFDHADLPKAASDLKNYLRRKFIEKKLNITPNPNGFDEEKTKKWLKCLAEFINEKKTIIFELADLQPSDLTGRWMFVFFCGLLNTLVFSLFGVSFKTSLLLLLILTSRRYREIKTQDNVGLHFIKVLRRSFWQGLLYGSLPIFIITGPVIILFFIPYFIWYGLSRLSVYALIVTIVIELLMLMSIVGFEDLKTTERFSKLETSYQRIKRSHLINSANLLSLTFISIVGLIILNYSTLNDEVLHFSILAVFLGVLFLSVFKLLLSPFFRHSVLRFCLYLEDKTPLKYATFLDYAAEARILEKDGGHWRFRHQNLQDYFADLNEQPESPASGKKLG